MGVKHQLTYCDIVRSLSILIIDPKVVGKQTNYPYTSVFICVHLRTIYRFQIEFKYDTAIEQVNKLKGKTWNEERILTLD